jgi:hypothetical protein
VNQWCVHARNLTSAKLVDRAHAAYRTLYRARRKCATAAKLADLRRAQRTRERRLERARSWRRAADLRRRKGQTTGRRAALRIAFAYYIGALDADPFAVGGRRGLNRLIADYRAIDPAETDCARARRLVDASLLPEARLFVSRGLRGDPTGTPPCSSVLASLQTRRTAAYARLRVGEARKAAGDGAGAAESFTAALRADSSMRSALVGLNGAKPRPLVQEDDTSDKIGTFFGRVEGVFPPPAWAAIGLAGVGLAIFLLLWGTAWLLAKFRWPRWFIERVPILRGVRRRLVDLELPADLTSDVRGYVDDTILRLNSTPITGDSPSDQLLATGTRADGTHVAVPVEELGASLAATPSLAVAAQLVRLGTNALRPRSPVGLALEHVSCSREPALDLRQRWRVFDRKNRETLNRVEVEIRAVDRPFLTRSELERHFTQTAGEDLRAAVLQSEIEMNAR